MLLVVKRDGRTVPFDSGRVEAAVRRCLQEDEKTHKHAEIIAKTAADAVAVRFGDYDTISVEEIQDFIVRLIERQAGKDAAKRYQDFREYKKKLRENRPIDPKLQESIQQDTAIIGDGIRYYQFVSKFARWLENEQRRETWSEACQRVLTFFQTRPQIVGKIPDDVWQKLHHGLYHHQASPAMRVLQMAGPALERCNVGAYNCSFLPIVDWRSYAELLYILMQGTGVGFSVETRFVENLPRIRRPRNTTPLKFTVPDDTEGWCEALRIGLETWADGGDVEYDYSQIRPAGTRLRTKGGRASGPEPLRKLLTFARDILRNRAGQFLRPIECHDLACMVGQIVQVGGVRRAALISLSDLDDHDVRDCKSGQWWVQHAHRSMANNSAVYENKPDSTKFLEEWLALIKSGSGERGIFNREAVRLSRPERRADCPEFGTNPCGEIVLRPYEFCNLSIAIARPDDTVETLAEKVRLATIWGTLQATLTHYRYIREAWKRNSQEEALLGVDITGQMDCPLLRPGANGREQLLEHLKQIAVTTNQEYAAILGINPSRAVTCVKPSGDSSVLFGCGSGVHPWFARYYIRRTREHRDSPVAKFLMDSGVPWVPAPENPSLVAFEWPCHTPTDDTPTRHDMTVVAQLENWLSWKRHWAEHSVSCTIYVGPEEWITCGEWVYSHFNEISGLSFLPRDNGTYFATPYEEITREEYEKRVAQFPKLNWAKLIRYETTDHTEASRTFACVGNQCEV